MSLLPHLAPSLSSSHDRRSINRPRVHRRPYCAIYMSRVWSWWHDRMSVLWTNSTNMEYIRDMNMKICSRKRYMESKSFYNTISFRNLSVIWEWQQKQCDVFLLKSYEVRLCLLNCIKEGVFAIFASCFRDGIRGLIVPILFPVIELKSFGKTDRYGYFLRTNKASFDYLYLS